LSWSGSVCSPSRAGLLTEKAPLCAGLPDNVPIPVIKKGAGLPTEQVNYSRNDEESRV
jgi:hypothetical protein